MYWNSVNKNFVALTEDKYKYKLSLQNPEPPQMYSLIQVHETGLAISYLSAPAVNILGFLIDKIV